MLVYVCHRIQHAPRRCMFDKLHRNRTRPSHELQDHVCKLSPYEGNPSSARAEVDFLTPQQVKACRRIRNAYARPLDARAAHQLPPPPAGHVGGRIRRGGVTLAKLSRTQYAGQAATNVRDHRGPPRSPALSLPGKRTFRYTTLHEPHTIFLGNDSGGDRRVSRHML